MYYFKEHAEYFWITQSKSRPSSSREHRYDFKSREVIHIQSSIQARKGGMAKRGGDTFHVEERSFPSIVNQLWLSSMRLKFAVKALFALSRVLFFVLVLLLSSFTKCLQSFWKNEILILFVCSSVSRVSVYRYCIIVGVILSDVNSYVCSKVFSAQ